METKRLALCRGGCDKFARGDEHAGQPARFEFSDVVHTARRAGASIGQGFDDEITVADDALDEPGRGDAGESRLLIAFGFDL